MGKISFYEEDVHLRYLKRIPARESLMKVIACLDCQCGDINYVFCSDGYLYKMNKEYLNHDTLTDIITFDYTSESDESQDDFIAKFTGKSLLHLRKYYPVIFISAWIVSGKTPKSSTWNKLTN